MKSFTSAAVLGLAVAASARPSPSRMSRRQDQCIVDTVTGTNDVNVVSNSINQWFNDVITVNNFLNTFSTLNSSTAVQQAAQTALLSAQDEPCQLMTLTSTSDLGSDVTAAFECAGQDLMRVFGDHVITPLNTIIGNPSDSAGVQAAVQDINDFRCCNVLSDASILWLDNAADNGLVGSVPTQAPAPNACASISCSQACTSLDNGVFGTVSGP
jgi:hypothetical protein